MIRRHPRRLRVVEAHPIDIYDCISLIDLRAPPGPDTFIAHFNLHGHITLGGRYGAQYEDDNRFNWYEVLAAADRRTYVVEQLEGALELRAPRATPRTTTRSIAARCIARFAAAAALSNQPWHIRAGFGFDSDYELARRHLFAPFDGIPSEELVGGDIPPASKYWFICDRDDHPTAAFDLERGLSWEPGVRGAGLPLIRLYRHHEERLDRLLAEVAPPIE